MAKKRQNYPQSEKHPYKSPYGEGFVTGVEYLTQTLVARELIHFGNKIDKFFWDNPRYATKLNDYRNRINKLLRDIKPDLTIQDVIRVYEKPDMKNRWSLFVPNLHQIMREEKAKAEAMQNIKPPEIISRLTNTPKENKPRKQFGKTGLLGKLRENDG